MPGYWYNKDGTRKPEYKGKKYPKKKGTGRSVLDKINDKLKKKGVPQERRVTKLWHEHKGNMKITKKASDDDRKAREKAGAVL